MKRVSAIVVAAALLLVAAVASAQSPPSPADSSATDSTAAKAPPADTTAAPAVVPAVTPAVTTPPAATPPPATPPPATTQSASGKRNDIYYGGTVGFNFWNDYMMISLEPMFAKKMKNPKMSLGGKLRYEYVHDSRYAVDYTMNNFGASVFSRYRVIPIVYAHAEYAWLSYDYPGNREGVSFLLLGGGYSKPMGKGVTGMFEVLWDVLNDPDSPYAAGEPMISVGVGVGF